MHRRVPAVAPLGPLPVAIANVSAPTSSVFLVQAPVASHEESSAVLAYLPSAVARKSARPAGSERGSFGRVSR